MTEIICFEWKVFIPNFSYHLNKLCTATLHYKYKLPCCTAEKTTDEMNKQPKKVIVVSRVRGTLEDHWQKQNTHLSDTSDDEDETTAPPVTITDADNHDQSVTTTINKTEDNNDDDKFDALGLLTQYVHQTENQTIDHTTPRHHRQKGPEPLNEKPDIYKRPTWTKPEH